MEVLITRRMDEIGAFLDVEECTWVPTMGLDLRPFDSKHFFMVNCMLSLLTE